MPIFEFHVDLAVPAATLWGIIERETDLLPQHAPEWFSAFEHHEGEGHEPGSVFTMHFGEKLKDHCGGKVNFAKFKTVSYDPEKRTVGMELVEGGYLQMFPSIHRWIHTYSVIEVNENHSKLQVIADHDGSDEELKVAREKIQEVMKSWCKLYVSHAEKESK